MAVVLLIPPLLAAYLGWSPEREMGQPRVSRILSSLEDGNEGSRGKSASTKNDSPTAGASIDDKSVGISFERGRQIALGKIEIPAISLKTKFFEGVTDESVEIGPGHWPGTPLPGAAGNSVFAGHRTTYTKPFEDLDLLKRGDKIRTGLRNAKPTTYRVFKKTVVPEAEYADFVLRQPKTDRARMITLFACTPKGFRTHRIVVQAKAVSHGGPGGETSGREAMS
ncbi:MAG: class E sortase [Actinomycetota bacterium]|nr:class E sortase [Actinomycetota bacterium]